MSAVEPPFGTSAGGSESGSEPGADLEGTREWPLRESALRIGIPREPEPDLASEPEPTGVEDAEPAAELEEEAEPEPAEVPGDAPVEVESPAEPAPAPGPRQHAAGELEIGEGYTVLEGALRGERRSVGVVVSRFNGEITRRLLASALEELERAGVERETVVVMPVPGAFELPLAALALAKTRRFACVVALGCVIRGETPHFDFVAGEAASGLQLAAIETGIPVSFGLLTCDTQEQAEERVGRGADAARAALEMADLFAQLRAQAAAAGS